MREKVPYYVREIRKGQDAAEQDNFQRCPRIMIACEGQKRGADRVTFGLLGLWRKHNQQPVAFAAGPSYEILQALRQASAFESYSLDSWFHDEQTLAYLLTHYTEGQRVAVIEARDNYFDTRSPLMTSWSDQTQPETPKGSPAELARLTATPVIMVVDASEFSFTQLAALKGLAEFRPAEMIAGFILAGVEDIKYQEIKKQIEAEIGLPVLGCVPAYILQHELPAVAAFVPNLYEEVFGRELEWLTKELHQTLDISAILHLADSAPDLNSDLPQELFKAQRMLGFEQRRYRLGVARDDAFCYYYRENLDLLEEMGADIVYFNPLKDSLLPADLDGMYFGSGKLLDYLAEASHNESMRMHIQRMVQQGVPVLAEGTGAVYLSQAYQTDSGREWPLVGILPTVSQKNPQPTPAYYATMTSRRDDLLCEHGAHLPCLLRNEFQFQPDGASYRTSVRGRGYLMEGFSTASIWASQAQLHFYANPITIARFTQACMKSLQTRPIESPGLQGGW